MSIVSIFSISQIEQECTIYVPHVYTASKEAHTTEQLQTAVHFAAKNDAVHSLKALIKMGCKYEDIRDYKMRTPLHVAAELGE